MKKLNKKGFTLIELLAVIIILGVLLLIAVPSVSRYITQSRQRTYATNLSKMVETVSTEVNSYNEGYTFEADEYLVVPVVCLELDRGSSAKSPFSKFVEEKTYVVVRREGANFKYEVAALDENGYGTALKDSTLIADTTKLEIAPVEGNAITAITDPADGDTKYTLALTGDAYSGKTANVSVCDAYKNRDQ